MKKCSWLLFLFVPLICFGDIISSTDMSATVTTTSSVIAPASNRQAMAIVNTGSVPCYLSLSGVATSGKGIYLAASGGFYNIDLTNRYRGAISAITASGTTTLSMSEGK